MSVTPPLQGDHTTTASDAESQALGATNRWGTVSGGLRSPPPAPSSGAGVRRNHTIHGARHHGKPRLEKHFEQPEDFSGTQHVANVGSSSAASASYDLQQPSQSSPSSRSDAMLDQLSSPTTRSDLTPLQALYSKSGVSRNLSLPSRHSTKVTSNLPHSATQGRSSLFNSLSAITGGSDLDEHEWEKLIHSSDALGDEHQQDPHASHSLRPDHPWSSSLFSQGQLGPAADSSHPASPVSRSDLFSESHHRPGSSSGVGLFDPAALSDAPPLHASTGFVRRHQSLNHHSGRTAANRLAARSSDLLSRYAGDVAEPVMSSYASRTDAAFSPARHTTSLSATNSPVMPTSFSKAPWNQPSQDPIGSPSRFAASFPSQNFDGSHSRMQSGIDASTSSLLEVSKNLSNLDISGSSALAGDDDASSLTPTASSLQSQSMHVGMSGQNTAADARSTGARRLPQLVTNRDALQRGQRSNGTSGPMSAAAFVPPIGHAHSRHQSNDPSGVNAPTFEADPSQRFGPFTAAPAGSWLEKDHIAGRFDAGMSADAQPWPQQGQAAPYPAMGMDPNVMALSMALAQEQQRNAILQAQLGARNNAGGMHEPNLFGMQPIDLNGPMQSIGQQLRGSPFPSSPPMGGPSNLPVRGQPYPMQPPQQPFRPPMHTQSPPQHPPGQPLSGPEVDVSASTPVDPTSLAISKGYNPPNFDIAPANARFFVIKSYTEDDVHKSLKYEIWASTDKGNQRLDKAFRESARDGPIYLFYSVNASGHFCGMAQMLTPLDYATSSNVWAQDGKWKGTFKVRWIYVKDLPNNMLRHIRLTNTQECKPVTQSRDTQELTQEAGREVLRIMAEWTPKTSLLQDFGFYEMQGRGAGGAQPLGAGQQGVRPMPSSPAMGMRNSPKPPNGASPALGFGGGVPYPNSPDFTFSGRPNAASPNAGARRVQLPGTPQRGMGITGLGLAPGTPRTNNGLLQGAAGSENQSEGSAPADGNKDAVSAAQVAGLAPSAL